MTTETATGIESTGPTSEEQITELLNRVEALESEVEEQGGQIDALESTVSEQQETIDGLESENEKLRERVEGTETEADHLLTDICDIESQLKEIDASGALESTPEEVAAHQNMTPIERVSRMDTDDTGIEVTPSIDRAVTIYEHWGEWSEKTPKGRVLKDGLKTLLRTATGDPLAWNQVYRACEALDELSKGEIQFMEHNRHGKMLIEPDRKPTTDDLQSSSVSA